MAAIKKESESELITEAKPAESKPNAEAKPAEKLNIAEYVANSRKHARARPASEPFYKWAQRKGINNITEAEWDRQLDGFLRA